MTTEHEGHVALSEREQYVAEKDEDEPVLCNYDNDAEQYDEIETYGWIVVNEKCSTAGWTEDDVVCRCASKTEADRIAKLLSEHGLSE